MAEKESLRRTGDCRIKLAPDMRRRIERMADHYGMPMATLAAFAVAEWISEQEHKLSMMRAQDLLKSPELVELLAQNGMDVTDIFVPDRVPTGLSQKNLPLDGQKTGSAQ